MTKKSGFVTSGSPAPYLKKNIGLAFVPAEFAKIGQEIKIDVRGKHLAAKIVPTPFYKTREIRELDWISNQKISKSNKSQNQIMANIPENLRYSKDHEWVSVDGDTATIGITDYAQHSLGDVVYVEMPKVGDKFDSHEAFGSVESVKAVSEIFTPVAGEVVEVNETLNDDAEEVNSDPYGEAWMVKIKMDNPGEADAMMSAAEYKEYLECK